MIFNQRTENEHIRDQSTQNRHRIRRADSWVELSRREGISDDEKFIALWIAFNSAYGDEGSRLNSEDREYVESYRFMNFLKEIVDRDEDGVIGDTLWNRHSPIVIGLVGNKYIYEPYWDWVRKGMPEDHDWQARFKRDTSRVNEELKPHRNRNVGTVLRLVFNRLYTLRNQVFHGGTTYAVGVGRGQIQDGAILMSILVPAILDVMRCDIAMNPDSDIWGTLAYPTHPRNAS
ncbi:MAG: hypothetical protein F4X57_07485 [Chloroflexi bacterium]|nr:hypothetical protein [Chloroflexota bacterium]